MKVRPGLMTAVCILAIMLGAAGLLTGFFGLVGLLVGEQMQQALAFAGDDAAGEIQAEMNSKLADVNRRWALFVWPTQIILLLVAGALLAGGIMALSLKPLGRRVLLGALIGALVFELARIVPTVLMARENMAITQEYMPQIMKATNQQGNAPQGMEQMMAGMINVFSIVTMVAMAAWVLLKCAFYIFGAWYLTTPRIRALSDPSRQPAENLDTWN